MTTFFGTSGNDNLDGTEGDDVFELGQGGNDTVSGGGGNDVFVMKHAYTDNDSLSGGDGYDAIYLKGDYTGNSLLFNGDRSIEEVKVFPHHSYSLDPQQAIDAGATFTLDARSLTSSDVVYFFGDTVSDAHLRLLGGHGQDILWGGALADRIYGGLGPDNLKGDPMFAAASADTFIYKSIADSPVAAPDTVYWDPEGGDRIDLHKIDADSTIPGNQDFTFIGSADFSNTAGELRFEPFNSGYVVQGDVNGDGVADFAIWTQPNNLSLPGSLTSDEFVL